MRRARPRFASGVDAFCVTTLYGRIVEEAPSLQSAKRYALARANENGRAYYVARLAPFVRVSPTKPRSLRVVDPTVPDD